MSGNSLSGLLFILLSVSCSLCIAHLLKIVQRKELSVVPILVINYVTAAGLSLLNTDRQVVVNETSFITLCFATAVGSLFIINFFLYSYSLEKNGVGISIAAMRLSLVLPVIVSVWFYNEKLQAYNYVGILFVFISLLLLIPTAKQTKGVTFSVSLMFIFLLNGLVDVLLKIYDREFAPILSKDHFLFLIFSAAFFVGVSYLVVKKSLKFDLKSIFYGILIGIVNLYSSFFLLSALEKLSGALVFSTTNLLNVFLGTILGYFYWRDQLVMKQCWGIILAVFAIILLII